MFTTEELDLIYRCLVVVKGCVDMSISDKDLLYKIQKIIIENKAKR